MVLERLRSLLLVRVGMEFISRKIIHAKPLFERRLIVDDHSMVRCVVSADGYNLPFIDMG